MSPIHILVWASAFFFQVMNATCIGGWLAGYGPTSDQDWQGRMINNQVGLMLFAVGLFGNMWHDEELRAIRRAAARQQKLKSEANDESDSKSVEKVYMIPRNGLFEYCLYPHYLCEWVEWAGFWVIGGLGCIPARSFLINELTTMAPRALSGRRWYIKRFGKEKIGNKAAVIPGIL